MYRGLVLELFADFYRAISQVGPVARDHDAPCSFSSGTSSIVVVLAGSSRLDSSVESCRSSDSGIELMKGELRIAMPLPSRVVAPLGGLVARLVPVTM
jgi:hypothetical protein